MTQRYLNSEHDDVFSNCQFPIRNIPVRHQDIHYRGIDLSNTLVCHYGIECLIFLQWHVPYATIGTLSHVRQFLLYNDVMNDVHVECSDRSLKFEVPVLIPGFVYGSLCYSVFCY